MSSSGHIVLGTLPFQDSRRHDFADCQLCSISSNASCGSLAWPPTWQIWFFFSLSFIEFHFYVLYWLPFFHLTVCYIFLTFIQEFVFFWNYLQSFFRNVSGISSNSFSLQVLLWGWWFSKKTCCLCFLCLLQFCIGTYTSGIRLLIKLGVIFLLSVDVFAVF